MAGILPHFKRTACLYWILLYARVYRYDVSGSIVEPVIQALAITEGWGRYSAERASKPDRFASISDVNQGVLLRNARIKARLMQKTTENTTKPIPGRRSIEPRYRASLDWSYMLFFYLRRLLA